MVGLAAHLRLPELANERWPREVGERCPAHASASWAGEQPVFPRHGRHAYHGLSIADFGCHWPTAPCVTRSRTAEHSLSDFFRLLPGRGLRIHRRRVDALGTDAGRRNHHLIVAAPA